MQHGINTADLELTMLLLGGLFTFVCPHGLCYGFHIIPKAEGRNDVFTTIKKRFKIAPHIIVYDFACQLMEYCLNRDPGGFSYLLLLPLFVM